MGDAGPLVTLVGRGRHVENFPKRHQGEPNFLKQTGSHLPGLHSDFRLKVNPPSLWWVWRSCPPPAPVRSPFFLSPGCPRTGLLPPLPLPFPPFPPVRLRTRAQIQARRSSHLEPPVEEQPRNKKTPALTTSTNMAEEPLPQRARGSRLAGSPFPPPSRAPLREQAGIGSG